jgi:hypothetical protein
MLVECPAEKPMNLKRGFFRLWLVGSVLFSAAVAVYSAPSITEEFNEKSAFDQYLQRDPDIMAYQKMLRNVGVDARYAMLGRVAVIAIGVPIGVLVIGAGLFWAASGFKTRQLPRGPP